ncbi:unnamed protein product [Calicophoron daubneyi]|uniref:Uncharacterized protein n=1 Tax=Calicophoron daubneyi TaxID=300641 RepID=A0AAV2T7J2_CALDB
MNCEGIQSLIDEYGKVDRGKEYYEKLTQVLPPSNDMSLNDINIFHWGKCTKPFLDDKPATTENRAEYRDIVKETGFKRRMPIYPCTQGNPITIIDQDVSRLRKISRAE